MKVESIIRTLAIVLLTSAACVAVVDVGTPRFQSFGGSSFDQVNLGNLNVHTSYPVFSKAGRGVPFSYVLTNDSSVWYAALVGGVQTWQPASNWQWRRETDVATGYVSYSVMYQPCTDPYNGSHETYASITFGPYVDAQGVSHPWSTAANVKEDLCELGYTEQRTVTASDGSGYSMDIDVSPSATVKSRDGDIIIPTLQVTNGSGTIKDSNGNKITTTGTVFTDTLGTTVLTKSGTNPVLYTYTAPSGASASVSVTYSTYTVRTNFGCSGIAEYGTNGTTTASLPSSISYPDGSAYSFTYEATPGYSGSVTGRLASVTLPTGGTISYAYTGGNNGIICADGSTAGLTRTTPDGASTYARSGSDPAWTTTVTDPQNNQTVLNFQKVYETQRQSYQGSATGTPLQTTVTCYSGNLTNCNTTAVTLPISRRTVTVQLPNSSGLQSKTDTFFNTNGLPTQVDEYAFGSGAPGSLARQKLVTYATMTNGPKDRVASVTIKDGSGVTKAQTNVSYDQTSVTATTGTPQHDSITTPRGNPTTISQLKVGTTYLTKTATYYDTGTVKTSTDVNGAVTTLTYGTGSCGNSFATSVALPLSLTRSTVWDCTGAVATSSTDENGKTSSVAYTDSYFWRPASSTDPLSNVVNLSYASIIQSEGSFTFNSSNSIVDVVATRDNLGRPRLTQRKQSPSASNYDTVQTDYDSLGRTYRSTLPFSTTLGATSGSAPGTTTSYDALGRITQVSDSGGGSLTVTYSVNDVLQSLGPAPTGENAKATQREYDALGRLTSVCEITSATGSGTCGQGSSQTGYWTTYVYDTLGNMTGVTQNAQAASGSQQTRSFTYDMLGRITSETNPETGTTTYTYESATGCTGTYNGDLLKRVDAVGNTTCYTYDSLHRLTQVTYSGSYAANTPTKKFVYDTATVNSVVMANAKTRLAEAYTCTGACTTKITDLGFSYTARGEVADVYQSAPNSGGYYHLTATYWPHGLLNTLSGLPSLPTLTSSSLDGQGRTTAISAGSGQSPLTAVSYNVAGQPTAVTLGSGDGDTFTYDSNTNAMTQYLLSVGATPQTVTGDLTWNSNGSLGALQITDQIYSANNQTCTYAHDDLRRISSANCGTPWSQTFSYDAFGNISKSGSSSFQPTYTTSPPTNRIASLPSFTPTYDNNGNLTADSLHTYSWDAEGRPVTIDSVTLTYDALGRMAEQNRSGSYTEVVYGPLGNKLALMTSQSLQKAFVPLAGGAVAVYNANGLSYYRHPDLLGSSRLSTTPVRGVYSRTDYAPFGEAYNQSGTPDVSFTGVNQDTVTGIYDALFRKLSAAQGRWVSPDPLGVGAVNPGLPQSWNRYGYVLNNPLNNAVPVGLLGPHSDLMAGDFYRPSGLTSSADEFAFFPGALSTLGGKSWWLEDDGEPGWRVSTVERMSYFGSHLDSNFFNATDISDRGIRFIGDCEAFRASPYNDQAGNCTVGYGHLLHFGGCDGSESTTTKSEALTALKGDVSGAASAVRDNVDVPLNQYQFDALTSFTINVGPGRNGFGGSTLLRELNAGNYDAVPGQLMRWNRAGGRVSPGLVNRRQNESDLYTAGDYNCQN